VSLDERVTSACLLKSRRYVFSLLEALTREKKLVGQIYNSITGLCASSDDNLIEAAVVALGNVCLSPVVRSGPLLTSAVQLLLGLWKVLLSTSLFTAYLNLHLLFFNPLPRLIGRISPSHMLQRPREETHFTIGEALSVAASGWNSTASADPLVVLRDPLGTPLKTEYVLLEKKLNYHPKTPTHTISRETDEPMKTILRTILQSYLFSDRVETRSPAAIWLLSVIKDSGGHPLIVRNLMDIQQAFTLLLSDNNDLIQEVGAKG
jgi:hypothetical protein